MNEHDTSVDAGHLDSRAIRALLEERYSLEELEILCHTLGINYENIAGNTKSAKCLQLVLYAERHGLVPELSAEIKRKKPRDLQSRGQGQEPSSGLLQQPLWISGTLAAASLIISLLWLMLMPGFEPLLAVLAAISLVIGVIAVRHRTQWLRIAAVICVFSLVGLGYVLWSSVRDSIPTNAVVVRVIDKDGDPIGVATVMILSVTGTVKEVTDTAGLVRLPEVPLVPNSQLIVEVDGYRPHNEVIDVAERTPHTVVLVRNDANQRSILCRVIEAERFAPVRNAQIMLIIGSTQYTEVTDDNGLARFDLPFAEPTLLADITVTVGERQVSNQHVTLLPDRLQNIRVSADRKTLDIESQ